MEALFGLLKECETFVSIAFTMTFKVMFDLRKDYKSYLKVKSAFGFDKIKNELLATDKS